ncbi:hypothetical protein EJ04DRAFT_231016 [Polyplosphaeria fusca]|uniref:Uncharacterized protein n=1 Tax=Polyplosphaeria fusca TaxID=682080 RepID=A0A9P4R0T4_9PLEO|nr:hypothetical protein EJ04DRAFT_231016 [Polyplosphaeria fusca]
MLIQVTRDLAEALIAEGLATVPEGQQAQEQAKEIPGELSEKLQEIKKILVEQDKKAAGNSGIGASAVNEGDLGAPGELPGGEAAESGNSYLSTEASVGGSTINDDPEVFDLDSGLDIPGPDLPGPGFVVNGDLANDLARLAMNAIPTNRNLPPHQTDFSRLTVQYCIMVTNKDETFQIEIDPNNVTDPEKSTVQGMENLWKFLVEHEISEDVRLRTIYDTARNMLRSD